VDPKTKILDRDREEREKERNSKSSSSSSSTTGRSESASYTRKVEDGRYDGGLGGSANNGEWQVELAFTARDPRDPSRSTGGAPVPLYPTTAVDETEEFPALPSDTRSSGSLNNINWLKPRDKIDNFPGLPARKNSGKDSKKGNGKYLSCF
jgi:hypothetical protein